MKSMEEFFRYFTNEEIKDTMQIKNSFFLADKGLMDIKSRISQEPFSIGLFLGEVKNNNFIPGANLLDMISKKTDKKIFVNRKTGWLFLCGRDVFGRGIVKADVKKGLVLVQNENDENLGYGEITADLSVQDKVVVKNLFDRGNFLRREK
jgi:ribosome biogenesis protein Nip4